MEQLKERATDILWWLGWRPLVAGSIGAVGGVLVGYASGAVGGATAAFGVVLIAVGALKPFLRKLGFLVALFAFSSSTSSGRESAEGALETVGVGADWLEFVAVFILNVGSLVGVETANEPTEVVGGAVAALALWSLAGAAVGGVGWLGGAYTVNRKYAEVYEEFVEKVENEGRSLLGDGGEFHSLTHGEETAPVVDSAREYRTSNLLVGESSLSLHHGSSVDMVKRETEIGSGTKELYYDQVASVDYDDPFVKIRMSDGEEIRIVSSGKPEELIDGVQRKVEKYKR